ncbi:hypothetical protein M0R45_027604 [Rubus argutus]|uniref:Uncharacterized protein n=1 Tax=Rubus argutus TaxID=59490 RepID=A0AAW1X3H2_RUBAR
MAEEEETKYISYFDEDETLGEDEYDEVTEVEQTRSKKRVGPPVEEDWDRAAIFVKFLKVFYDVTLRISASNHPTAARAFHDIVAIQENELNCNDLSEIAIASTTSNGAKGSTSSKATASTATKAAKRSNSSKATTSAPNA